MNWRRLLAAWTLVPIFAQAQICMPNKPAFEPHPPSYFRYSFLLDTSTSMVSRDDSRAILFPQLQEKLLEFIRSIRGRAEVWVTPFNRGALPTARFRLPEDRLGIESYISGLEVSEANTWLYRSLQDILSELPANPAVGNVVYILSSGIDNDPQPPNLSRILQVYESKRGPNDFLYYVGLDQTVPADIQTAFSKISLACTIATAPGVVPDLAHAAVSPDRIDLGNFKLEPGARSVQWKVQFQGPSTPLTVNFQSETLKQAGGQMDIEPSILLLEQGQLRFRLSQTTSLPDGNYAGYLVLTGPPGTVVTPAVVPVELAFNPGAAYSLVLLRRSEEFLPEARKTTFSYRLEGNQWATEPITIGLSNLPQGLLARLNGAVGPVRLRPGQTLTIDLLHRGTENNPGQWQLEWSIRVPSGARLALPRPPAPPTNTGTFRLWWLLVLLLPMTLIGAWVWRSRKKPRRILGRTPTTVAEFSAPYAYLRIPSAEGPRQLELKEGQLVDLGLLWDNPLLQGLLLVGTSSGARIEKLPEGATLLSQGLLYVGSELRFHEPVHLMGKEGLIGSFVVSNPKQATLLRWGKARFTPTNSLMVCFDLGGLEAIDLGRKLNFPPLQGFYLSLSRGGLRLLELPAGLRGSTGGVNLQPGCLIPFEQAILLESAQATPIGEVFFEPLDGIPVPLMALRYLGGRPEQRSKTALITAATDLGEATGDLTLNRLRISPLPEGARVEHVPGHLRLVSAFATINPGDIVPMRQSLFLLELSSKLGLGVVDILEP